MYWTYEQSACKVHFLKLQFYAPESFYFALSLTLLYTFFALFAVSLPLQCDAIHKLH